MKFKISIDYRSCNYPLAFFLFFNASFVFADDELFFEMPIVLSANRLEQPVSDAAVSISVIDRDTIEASGARTIPEVLRLIPGMQVGFSGNQFGDEPKYVVTYHGHSDQYSKQMQVLIDGRSIYEPLIGGILWKAIPVNIDDIERIEVSRGPNLATYGSNTFQAAINIITRTAAEDQGSYVRTNIGNHDIADLTYRYGGNSGKLDYRITGSTLNDDGLDSKNEIDYPDDTNSNNIDYRLDYQVDNHNTLSYQGGYGVNRQQADRNHVDVLPTERTVENTRFFQFIKLESAINAENTIQVQYYYNLSDKEDAYTSDDITIPSFDTFSLDIQDDIKAERHNLELTHSIYPDKDLKLVWGLSAQNDLVIAPQALGTEEQISHEKYRAFANIEWHVNQSNIINLGGLVEANDISETELSPRLSFTHAFNRAHKIRFGISQATRSPFIYESNANVIYSHDLTVNDGDPTEFAVLEQVIIGNQNLDNEKITSREIAYFGEFLNASLLFNARLFHDDISGYIDSVREPVDPASGDNVVDDPNDPVDPDKNTVLVFQNPIDSTTTGFEIELDYHIDASLRLIASGAIINISSNENYIRHSAPQHSFSLLLNKRFNENYKGSLAYYFVDEFKWTDAPDLSQADEASTEDYHALDMRLSRNFNFRQTHGSLSLVLKNLLGDYSDYQKHQISSTAPQAVQNTTAYIDFRLNF